jgi:hypothetical protein
VAEPQLFIVRSEWQFTTKLLQRCRKVLQTFITLNLQAVRRMQLLL